MEQPQSYEENVHSEPCRAMARLDNFFARGVVRFVPPLKNADISAFFVIQEAPKSRKTASNRPKNREIRYETYLPKQAMGCYPYSHEVATP